MQEQMEMLQAKQKALRDRVEALKEALADVSQNKAQSDREKVAEHLTKAAEHMDKFDDKLKEAFYKPNEEKAKLLEALEALRLASERLSFAEFALQEQFEQTDNQILSNDAEALAKEMAQLAEEIVRVGTRSREILRNRIIDPTSQDFVFDESNEYLITNPTEDQLVKIMAQTYTRKYLSGVVPFDLASNTNLQMYQTVQVEDTEVESIGETGVTINDIPTKFPVTRSGHYQLTVLESFSKILTGRPKQLEVTHQLNEQQHQQLNSIFRQINRVYPIKNVDTYQIKPIGHPDLLLSLWNLNASGMTKTF